MNLIKAPLLKQPGRAVGRFHGCRLVGVFLVSIIFHVQLVSQTIEIQARVVDSSNQEPVAFATLFLNEHTGTIADELGFFRLQVPENRFRDTLQISCIGYGEKRIPVNGLGRLKLDTIYLQPSISELGEVQITARSGKIPGSRQIIRQAVKRIPDNYAAVPVVYNGYYREYIRQEDEYINLFESILNLEDPGIRSLDNFEAGLQYKRINRDFRVDSLLMRPYDNRDKLVPYSFMPIPLNNELVILRAHDPVRNFDRHSLYFFDVFEKDFIRNHVFSPPKLTYLKDRPFYLVTYKDNRKYAIGNNHITTAGSIYIDALNYGIKRIAYTSTVDDGSSRRRLFGLNLEYERKNEMYLLHYLSFNNLFYTRNFALVRAGIWNDRVLLTFNKPVDETCEGNTGCISVYLEGEKQEIAGLDVEQTHIYLSFPKNSALGKRLRFNLQPRNMTTRYKLSQNLDYLTGNLRFEFNGLTDNQDHPVADKEFNEYYQYREFFTNRIASGAGEITSNLVDKSIPVIENRIFGTFEGDTSWLNTPLIREEVATRTYYTNNPELNRYLEQNYRDNGNRLNEMVYIQTDREVYAPEDTLWFRAYIRNRKSLSESELSKVFHVLLADGTGRILNQDRYLVDSSGARGQIVLPHTLEEGIYYLAGYTSWMENFGTESLFTKRILVEREKREGHLLVAAFEKDAYFPGDTVKMLVNCYDDFNRPVDDVSFRYRLVDGNKVILRGQGTTGKSWLEPLRMVLPGELGSQPMVDFRAIYQSEVLDTGYVLPVTRLIQLDFFPEGGTCINGIPAHMAFKAADSRGEPLDVKGEITDEDGRVVSSAGSEHKGMGVFTFTPERGKLFYFRVTQPSSLGGDQYELPRGTDKGWQLKLLHPANGKELELEVENVHTGNDTALVTVKIRDYLCYSRVIRIRGRSVVRIQFNALPPGIAVLTLFDHQLVPRAERLCYVPPVSDIHATLETDRLQYLTRDSVRIRVHLESDRPVLEGGSYALAVIDNQLCSTGSLNEPGIRSSLLLTPEIRGHISDPDYYFRRENKEAPAQLDLLLLTQGWRRYLVRENKTKEFLSGAPVNRDVLSGRLVRPTVAAGRNKVEGRITVLFGGNSTAIPVERDGAFSFLPDYSPDHNNELYMYAEDNRGRSNLSILLDSNDFENGLEDYLHYLTDSLGKEKVPRSWNREQLQEHFSYSLENHYWLEEVVIRKTVEKKELSVADLAIDKRVARPEDIEMAFDMEDLETLVRKPNPQHYPVYYVVDGLLQFRYDFSGYDFPVMVPDYSYARNIRPGEIKSYTVVSGEEVQALYGYGIMYVIDVKTKPVSERPDSRWTNPLTVPDFSVAKEFYRPRYDTEQKRYSTVPDLRKTIHWEPDLRVGEDGTATVTFYNGDRYTRIKCTLEGITEEGVPVSAETYYTVGLTRE